MSTINPSEGAPRLRCGSPRGRRLQAHGRQGKAEAPEKRPVLLLGDLGVKRAGCLPIRVRKILTCMEGREKPGKKVKMRGKRHRWRDGVSNVIRHSK